MEEHGMAKKDAMATARGSKLVTALAAAFAILVASHGAAACTKGTTGNRTADGKAADKEAGGPMAELSVKRLGTVETGTVEANPTTEERIDPRPAVLWAGDQPAAVITYRAKLNMVLRYASQSFDRVEGHGGPFPITDHFQFLLDDKGPAGSGYSSDIYTADIDGDGVDELVLLREQGGVEVHSLKKTLFKHSIGKHFRPTTVHRARAGGREVLYVQFELDGDEGAKERTAVLRVDAGGITRLPLGDAVLREGDVLTIGAVNLPGSQAIDELLVFSKRKDEVFLSRHRPDGRPIDTPRKVYVAFSDLGLIEFSFLPQSRRAVVFHHGSEECHFVQADKPVNWIRPVDLAGRRPKFLQVVDVATDPKVIFLAEKALYALNQEGTYFTWNGSFVPSEKMEPFLRIRPPGAEFGIPLVFVQDGGGEEILIVHSRKHQLRDPPFEEVLKAAERFLNPEDVARNTLDLEPTLEEPSLRRDGYIEDEQKKRGIERRPQTVEEWKKVLPESYAAAVADKRSSFTSYTIVDLQLALDRDGTGQARHPDELRAWLAALDVPAKTSFDLYLRSAKLGSFQAPGFLDYDAGVAFRARRALATVVASLMPTGKSGERAPIYLVHWNGER
jgi:hypothetical protein